MKKSNGKKIRGDAAGVLRSMADASKIESKGKKAPKTIRFGRYEEGGKLTKMKKKKAGITHRDGTRAVPNFSKAAAAADARKELRRSDDYEQHRQTSGSNKPGSARLAHELRGSTSGYDRPGGHNVASLVKKKKRKRKK